MSHSNFSPANASLAAQCPVDQESDRSLIQTRFLFRCGARDTQGTRPACSLLRPALREQDAQVAAREKRELESSGK